MANIGDNVGDKSWRVVVDFDSYESAKECYTTLKELWYEPEVEELTVRGVFDGSEVDNG